jgi:hypothetical protein
MIFSNKLAFILETSLSLILYFLKWQTKYQVDGMTRHQENGQSSFMLESHHEILRSS